MLLQDAHAAHWLISAGLFPEFEESTRIMPTLKLPDAVQAASALVIDADALVTHDRDFSAVSGLTVMQ